MYRQVGLKAEGRNFHRILWRDESTYELKHLRMLRVIYGVSCSAHLSIRCLREIANKTSLPHVATALNDAFYVDDFLGGADSRESAQKLIENLRGEFNKHGFPLRKWASSDPELIRNMPNDLRAENDDLKLFSKEYNVKALGISWKPNKDIFVFKCDLDPIDSLTKRRLLSAISKLFDPLGWLAPVVILFKVLMQQTWVRGLDWNDSLPTDIETTWRELSSDLPAIRNIQIPRPVVTGKMADLQIHVFADASEKAYAAVIFSRATDTLGNVSVSILASKTRVAPVKTVSLPRLELCGAELASKLASTFVKILDVTEIDSSLHAWTDSTIVLHWLSQLPKTWTTFVANRVSAIQAVLPRSRWKHVPSADNPADLASRGCKAMQLSQTELWWIGPKWLAETSEKWPHSSIDKDLIDDLPEKRVKLQTLHVVSTTPNYQTRNELSKLVNVRAYSSLKKLIRILAYVLHFIKRVRKEGGSDDPLQPENLKEAKFLLIRMDQKEYFSDELAVLRKDEPLEMRSKHHSLAPFLDRYYNVIRVGERLAQSPYNEGKKFPVLISKDSPLALLLVHHYHEVAFHGGGQLTLNLIRQEFWIVNAKPLVNRIIRNCVTCYRFNTSPPTQLMADLPADRVTPSGPFHNSRIDFAGPFLVKNGDNEIKKVYIALFICMSTKAIHMELVSSLTKDDCILALRRFIARRGKPARIITDNGTNFLGARRDLLKLRALLDKNDKHNSIITFIHQVACEWLTIPPRAPHFGGIWEVAIKSMKRHLRRVVGLQILSYEKFLTVLNQIEAILNSRPLFPLTNDPNDTVALTPAHFLIGDTMHAMPGRDTIKMNASTRFKLIQKIQEDFWKSWKREYPTELQIRRKWFLNGPEYRVGDLVLIAEDNEVPLQWKTCRIIEIYSGNDDIVRVCKVKTSSSTFIRPIVKLRKLPIDVNTSDVPSVYTRDERVDKNDEYSISSSILGANKVAPL